MIKKVIKILVLSMFILLTGCFGKEDTKELNEVKLKQLTKIISDIQEYKKQNTRTITGEILDGIYVKSERGYDYYNLNKLKSMTFQEKAELFDKLDLASGESYVSIGNKTKLFFAYVDLADLSATGTDATVTIGLKTVVYDEELWRDMYADGSEVGEKIPEVMVLVPAGTTSVDNGSITISQSFYIGKYEVTQAEWQTVMGNNPSKFGGNPNNPVERVSWYDTIAFCNKKSIAEGLTPVYSISGSTNPTDWGAVPISNNATWNAVTANSSANGYRLPTDAEWEYAARGGAGGSAFTYAGSNNIEEVAWYWNNNETNGEIYGTKAVGRKQANELGIYDMSGNVWELCYDWYPGNEGSSRVVRGGCWGGDGNHCNVAIRTFLWPAFRNLEYGFRVARSF